VFRDPEPAALVRAGMPFEVVYVSASLPSVAGAAQPGFALTVMSRSGLEHDPRSPKRGSRPRPLFCRVIHAFGDSTPGDHTLAEPLVGLLRESLPGELAAA
jgi:hypothetical protein